MNAEKLTRILSLRIGETMFEALSYRAERDRRSLGDTARTVIAIGLGVNENTVDVVHVQEHVEHEHRNVA